jgi:hypothetical protein
MRKFLYLSNCFTVTVITVIAVSISILTTYATAAYESFEEGFVSCAPSAPTGLTLTSTERESHIEVSYEHNKKELKLKNCLPWIVEGSETGDAAWFHDVGFLPLQQHSARAGTISHNQNSILPITLDVAQSGHISFDIKVSSEHSYDFLVFYIDGIEQERWSGEVRSRVSYLISPGVRSFSWVYEKDFSISVNKDSAWIDNVSFPPSTSEVKDWWFSFQQHVNDFLDSQQELASSPIHAIETQRACQKDIVLSWVLQQHGQFLLEGIEMLSNAPDAAQLKFSDAYRELARFASGLTCLDFDGVRLWDSVIGSFLEKLVLEVNPDISVSEAVQALWNPALLVVDILQVTGDSYIVDVYKNNAELFRSALQDFPVDTYGAAFLEDFGHGKLVRITGPAASDNLVTALTHPTRLGVGLCSMLDHALKRSSDINCVAGLTEQDEICSDAGIVSSLRKHGLTSYVAHATFVDPSGRPVLPGQNYSGWLTTITEDYPKTYFGTPTMQLASELGLGGMCSGNIGDGLGPPSPQSSDMQGCIFDLMKLGNVHPGKRVMQCAQKSSSFPRKPLSSVEIRVPVSEGCGNTDPNDEGGTPTDDEDTETTRNGKSDSQENNDGEVNEDAILKAVKRHLDKNGGISEKVRDDIEKARAQIYSRDSGNTMEVTDNYNSAFDLNSGKHAVNKEQPDFLKDIARKFDFFRAALDIGGIPLTDDLGISGDIKNGVPSIILKGRFMPTPDGQGGCPQSAAEQRAQLMFNCSFEENEYVDQSLWNIYPTEDQLGDKPVACNEVAPDMFWWDKTPVAPEDTEKVGPSIVKPVPQCDPRYCDPIIEYRLFTPIDHLRDPRYRQLYSRDHLYTPGYRLRDSSQELYMPSNDRGRNINPYFTTR